MEQRRQFPHETPAPPEPKAYTEVVAQLSELLNRLDVIVNKLNKIDAAVAEVKVKTDSVLLAGDIASDPEGQVKP